MNAFAQSKEEASEKLQHEKLLNAERMDRIAKLQKKNAQQNGMLLKLSELLSKKNLRINKYKSRCLEYEEKMKSMLSQHVDVCTNTETIAQPQLVDAYSNTEQIVQYVDVHTNTEPIEPMSIGTPFDDMFNQTSEPTSNLMSDLNPHDSAAQIHPLESGKKSTTRNKEGGGTRLAKHNCPDCPFSTNKLDTLLVHRAEFCVNPPTKDRVCKYCGKQFTRRGLRVHINQYVANKHKATGKRKGVSLAEHQAYLDEIKAEIQ